MMETGEWATLLTLTFFTHMLFASVAISDLYMKSQRPFKNMWLALITIVPYAGVIVYHKTKKRQRRTW